MCATDTSVIQEWLQEYEMLAQGQCPTTIPLHERE